MKKLLLAVASALAVSVAAPAAHAADCDPGEIVIKFSHVVASEHALHL